MQGAANIVAGQLMALDLPVNFEEITPNEEGKIIAVSLYKHAAGMKKLFQVYAQQDLLAFINFSRAYTELERNTTTS